MKCLVHKIFTEDVSWIETEKGREGIIGVGVYSTFRTSDELGTCGMKVFRG